MRVKLDDLSPEKRAAVQDFKSDITSVFNDLYEEKWDQERWDRAVGEPFSPLDDQTTYRIATLLSRLTSVRSTSRSCGGSLLSRVTATLTQ